MNYKSGYYFLFNAITDVMKELDCEKDVKEIIEMFEGMQCRSEEIVIGKSKFLPRRGELLFGKNYSSSVTLTLKETGILEMLSKSTQPSAVNATSL